MYSSGGHRSDGPRPGGANSMASGTAGPRSDAEQQRHLEHKLLLAIREGDGRAFEQLYQRYATGLLNFILQRITDRAEAEELLQETFVRFLRDRRFEPTRATVGTYLYVIARNLTLNYLRDHSASRRLPLENTDVSAWYAQDQDAPDARLGQHQQLRALETALEGLPDSQREAFLLRHRQDRSYQEIAEIVNCPVGTAKSRVHLAISSLRDALEPAIENVRPLVPRSQRGPA